MRQIKSLTEEVRDLEQRLAEARPGQILTERPTQAREVQPIHPDSIMVALREVTPNIPFRQLVASFYQTDGSRLTLHMDAESAQRLAQTIIEKLPRIQSSLTHSDKSSEILNCSGSPTDGKGQ